MFHAPVDIFKNESEYLFVAELPGINKEELSVTVEDAQLTIRAETESEGKKVEKFRRQFSLPRGIDLDNIDAQLENGLLHLHVPIASEQSKRQISVN